MKSNESKSRKVSPKKQSISNYKWAKVLGWQIEELKEEIEKLKARIEIIEGMMIPV